MISTFPSTTERLILYDKTLTEELDLPMAGCGSTTFPPVRPPDVMALIEMAETTDDTTVIRAFRSWIREMINP